MTKTNFLLTLFAACALSACRPRVMQTNKEWLDGLAQRDQTDPEVIYHTDALNHGIIKTTDARAQYYDEGLRTGQIVTIDAYVLDQQNNDTLAHLYYKHMSECNTCDTLRTCRLTNWKNKQSLICSNNY